MGARTSSRKGEKSGVTKAYDKDFNHYMRPRGRCQEESVLEVSRGPSLKDISVSPGPHFEHDWRAFKAVGRPELVLEVPPVGKVEVHGMVERDHEGGGCDPDVGPEEDP